MQTDVIIRDEMEANNSTAEENKDPKSTTENETVTGNPTTITEEGTKEEPKEAEPTAETSTSQKRTLENEEEDDDTKKKRRKGMIESILKFQYFKYCIVILPYRGC